MLNVLVQSRRDAKAAKRLLGKLLKKQGRAPQVLVTDKLKPYAAAKRTIMPGMEHRQHKGAQQPSREFSAWPVPIKDITPTTQRTIGEGTAFWRLMPNDGRQQIIWFWIAFYVNSKKPAYSLSKRA